LAATGDASLGAAVAAALGQYRGARVEGALLELLSRDDAEVRRAAVVALGEAGTVRSVEAMLASGKGGLKEAVRDSVRRIQERIGDVEAGGLSLVEPVGPVGAVSVAQEEVTPAVLSRDRARD